MAHLRGDVDDRTGFGRSDQLAHDGLTHRPQFDSFFAAS
jgi:hypothetical protein